jgi:hypothetical protein
MLTYFALTFILTWSLWFASGIASPAGPSTPVFLLGVFTPGLVAMGLTARARGRAGVIALLERLIDWQVPARWYVFAIGYMAALKLVVAVVHRVGWGAWPRFGEEPWVLMLPRRWGPR